ncbi:MAG: SipW-dependent-type signal peptide-containing protein [Microbacterium sp.]|nr:SipW-dependent-type signal peptide-containing protein [Microbacterium sp.]
MKNLTSGALSTDRRRKITAVLAGGLVLGVGAAVTLAAWNDSEFAKSTFTAGSFVFQGSTNGTDFADHASEAGAAALTFSTGFDNLSPDDVVYAPFALKLTGSSAADVTATDPVVPAALTGALTFASVATTTFGCDAAAFAAGTTVPTTMQPGDTVNLCLQVTAGALTQGATGEVVWQWNAVSQ